MIEMLKNVIGLFALCCILSCNMVYAQDVLPHHNDWMELYEFTSKSLDTNVDVLSYDITLDWVSPLITARINRGDRKFEGFVHAIVVATSDLDSIPFYARSMWIDSIKVNGVSVGWRNVIPRLNIALPSPMEAGDTVDVQLFYAGGTDIRGFYAFAQEDLEENDLLHPLAFTFSQPEDARRWFPCNDVSSDKAYFTVHVRVPNGYTAVSNGVRIDSVADSDSTNIQSWHHNRMMPTYLFAVSVSQYHKYSQQYTNATRTIPIDNYHWLEDHDGQKRNALNALKNLPRMFEALEPRLGPYPWDTYGHVTISPTTFGGMEHQSMTTVNRKWLEGGFDVGYAHELGHQWLGDAVTCATWSDIWLNEGGASFCEALYREHVEGMGGYLAQMRARRSKYLETAANEPPIYGIGINTIFNEATTYCKSSWVYHMIRRLTTDSLFFPMLQHWVSDNMERSRQTYEFVDHVKSSLPGSPIDWDTFFDQWLMKSGHPEFYVQLISNDHPTNGFFNCQLRINQVQAGDSVPKVFYTPLTIRLVGAIRSQDTTVMIDSRQTALQLFAPFQIDSVVLDPEFDILCEQFISVTTGMDVDVVNSTLTVGPNPISAGKPLFVTTDLPGMARVYSMQGTLLVEQELASGTSAMNTASWPSGIVIVIIESGSKRMVRKISIVE